MSGASFDTDGFMNMHGFMQLHAEGGLLQAAQAPAASAAVVADPNPPNFPAAAENGGPSGGPPSRYESQKRRDWNTFGQYLRNHRPPLALAKCSGAHVLEFLRYLDQFGKTKVHTAGCPFFGQPQPPAACACPLRQAWGSLDALIGRLRAAYEENGGKPESNPFGARAVRLYLREVRETQAKARGIAYEKKKRKRPPSSAAAPAAGGSVIRVPSTAKDHRQGLIPAAVPPIFLPPSPASQEMMYSSAPPPAAQMAATANLDTGAPLHSSLSIPADHVYHHHHHLSQAPCSTRPGPPPLIRSFN